MSLTVVIASFKGDTVFLMAVCLLIRNVANLMWIRFMLKPFDTSLS